MVSKRFVVKAARASLALVVLVVLLLWMAGFFGEKIEPGTVAVPTAQAPEQAQTAVVEQATVPVIEEAAGTVEAVRKTVVSARITAVITAVRVRPGDQVIAGDSLIVFDDRELTARAEEARRALQAATAARSKVQNDFQRASRLLTGGVISKSEFDQAESAFKIANAEFGRAQQALQGAEVALTYAEITSAVTGRVIDRLADPGDTALPGKPLLALYDPTALRMEVAVREGLVAGLQVGERLRVRLGVEQETIDGTIDEIVPQAQAGSRTFLVKVGLAQRPGIYTGMFGRVLIPAGERTMMLIPEAAVEQVGQLIFVDVVGTDRTLTRRLVTLGQPAGGGRVEVLSGVRSGERVLLSGGRKRDA